MKKNYRNIDIKRSSLRGVEMRGAEVSGQSSFSPLRGKKEEWASHSSPPDKGDLGGLKNPYVHLPSEEIPQTPFIKGALRGDLINQISTENLKNTIARTPLSVQNNISWQNARHSERSEAISGRLLRRFTPRNDGGIPQTPFIKGASRIGDFINQISTDTINTNPVIN